MTNKAIYFDMDGTLANLYGTPDWLAKLRDYDTTPYETAPVLLNMQALARRLNRLHKLGYTIGIISWLSKESTAAYDEAVTKAKLAWLKKHLGSVEFDEIHIVPYGQKKSKLAQIKNGIIFDDDKRVRKEWNKKNPNGWAFSEKNIFTVLDAISVRA